MTFKRVFHTTTFFLRYQFTTVAKYSSHAWSVFGANIGRSDQIEAVEANSHQLLVGTWLVIGSGFICGHPSLEQTQSVPFTIATAVVCNFSFHTAHECPIDGAIYTQVSCVGNPICGLKEFSC